tara:strand:- start:1382 stop:1789 length:408 start_codon:yes stop_codon:yes gene_type:complete
VPTSERRSKTFRDINLSFKRHPVTNDLVTIKNEDAIKRSVYNIVQTIFGEKPFLTDFGTIINASLFELDTSLNYIAIQNQITASLKQYEPRIIIDQVEVDVDGANHEMSAKISYDIVGMESPTQMIDVLLHPARV